jgi:hypothetical protein
MASSAAFFIAARFATASFATLLSAASLSAATASSSTTGLASESCHIRFCRGSSSSDDTSSSRMTRVCLPLPGAAVLEQPAALEPPRGASSTARRGATAATWRIAAYRDASMAMTTSGAAWTARVWG